MALITNVCGRWPLDKTIRICCFIMIVFGILMAFKTTFTFLEIYQVIPYVDHPMIVNATVDEIHRTDGVKPSYEVAQFTLKYGISKIILEIIYVIATIVVACLLDVGVKRRNRKLMIPYMVYAVIVVLFHIVDRIVIVSIYVFKITEIGHWLLSLMTIIEHSFLFLIVISYYQELGSTEVPYSDTLQTGVHVEMIDLPISDDKESRQLNGEGLESRRLSGEGLGYLTEPD
ncbi:unnamed protein product [Meganyctiphanes norvegica]|uniref:Transmembrane protein n=1 Tax=Meganyctiphanes norvegica TaxID=48144 RepID=A0AAV2S049_MEGNR